MYCNELRVKEVIFKNVDLGKKSFLLWKVELFADRFHIRYGFRPPVRVVAENLNIKHDKFRSFYYR